MSTARQGLMDKWKAVGRPTPLYDYKNGVYLTYSEGEGIKFYNIETQKLYEDEKRITIMLEVLKANKEKIETILNTKLFKVIHD